jgi:hypothetical protein
VEHCTTPLLSSIIMEMFLVRSRKDIFHASVTLTNRRIIWKVVAAFQYSKLNSVKLESTYAMVAIIHYIGWPSDLMAPRLFSIPQQQLMACQNQFGDYKPELLLLRIIISLLALTA